MKLFKGGIAILAGLMFLSVAFVNQSEAQTRREAVQAFNKGIELANQGNYDEAISAYMQVISISDKIGKDAQDIKEKAEGKIPQIYLQKAVSAYKEYQKSQNLEKLNTAIQAFQETQEVGKDYGQQQIAEKAASIVPQLYYSKAIYEYKTKNYSEALATLDKALEKNPDYSKAYYQKGLVLKNMSDDSLMAALQEFDRAIQSAEKNNNPQMVSQATEAAKSNLVYRGATAIEDKNFQQAVDLLQRALKYDPQSEDAHFRLAEAYNKLEQWDKALEHANTGLQYEKGGRTEKAKIYFEKAVALKNMGNKDQACEAFGNAAYGSFKAPAEHEMKYNLECPEMTSASSGQ